MDVHIYFVELRSTVKSLRVIALSALGPVWIISVFKILFFRN
jgi:hypothetical protein